MHEGLLESLIPLASWFFVVELLGFIAYLGLCQLAPQHKLLASSVSRTFGIFVFSWVCWWAAFTGVMSFSQSNVQLAFFVVAALTAIVLLPFFKSQALKSHLHISLVYLIIFIIMTIIISFRPDVIETEKINDYHYLRAIMDSLSIPPPDTWFSGKAIRYYYFGYTAFATVGHIAGVDAPFVYNLAVASIPALAGVLVYGLIYYWTSRVSFAALAVGLTFFASNLRGILDALGIMHQPFHFWNASRAVSGGITEFPFFSAFLGDLHPHYMAVPLLCMFVAWMVLAGSFTSRKRNSIFVIVSSLLLGLTYATNSWNLPFSGSLLFTTLLIRATNNGQVTLSVVGRQALTAFAMLLMGMAFVLPFLLYSLPKREVPLSLLPYGTFTSLAEFFLTWGYLWLFVLPLYVVVLRERSLLSSVKFKKSLIGPLVVAVITLFIKPSIALSFMVATMVWVVLALPALWKNEQVTQKHKMLVALLLLLGASQIFIEVFFFDDIFEYGDFIRVNTVFKFGYIVTLLLPLVLIGYLSLVSKKVQSWTLVVLVTLFSAGTLYGFRSVQTIINVSQSIKHIPTLNGLAYLETYRKEEQEAVKWLRKNLLGTDALILEHVESSHGWGGRLAAFSGVNSVLNWSYVERTLRGNDVVLDEAKQDLNAILDGESGLFTLQALTKYNISHVAILPYEQEKHKLQFTFEYRYKPVFYSGTAKIYEIRSAK